MKPEELVALMIPLTWLAMLVIEQFRPARQWPALRLWRTRGLAFFAMLMAINALLPSLLAAESFGWHVFDGARLGVAGGAITGFLAVSLVNALLHRAYHRYGLLWLQRPESHCVHHRRGFHAWNYADFPLWDVLAGTFRNPREFRGDVGFDPRASQSLLATLGGRDANAALYGPENRGSADPSANPA